MTSLNGDNFKPVLLSRLGLPNSQALSTYQADGGYTALRKALAMQPNELIDLVKASGLRGRGGAGFPTGMKWSFLPQNVNGPIYMCINGDESEPGTFNNRIIIEEDPHQILEGIVIGCYATKATTAYFYLRYEYGRCYRTLQKRLMKCMPQISSAKIFWGPGTTWIFTCIAGLVPTFAVKRPD